MREFHQRLVPLLKKGARNVTSSYELARQLGVPQRTIGFAVSDLRRRGHLIGSIHGEGYYLIETEEELNATIDHIERRKAGIDETIYALQDAWGDHSTPPAP